MADLSKLESGGTSGPLAPTDPMMIAWEQFRASESFANSRKWAAHDEYLDGSLWNCFMVGWQEARIAERERCAAILNDARMFEIDTDLRSIRSRIQDGNYKPKSAT